ncbi:PadR family transcriptional regulator [Saccharothrix algeriensis]|uniref:DNA-binding PadR family transcriptional regulator n=1 Tax=Saccharothrix algeriensis TaxID=173560 RepID=A0A8T8I640_9PSEU|nr:PadR family transcriptional regulator [Saccharothrix algeriensis]MBM7813404.1 DNA-binding PadR family transcriptional regulator [Saccharothrix algeriensis]QTR06333.1 helix-turn-helix transcriptional regulator [Saccharothrix algeriensis]
MRSHHGHHERHHRERGFGDPRRGFGGGFGPFGGPPVPPGPPDFHHGGPGRGRHGRQRRGNVRAAVLTLLLERPMHGYEMIQEIGRRTDGLWRPSPGSVYPTLQLLADEGLVAASEEAGGKKLFTLTGTGQAEAAKLEGAPPWQQVNDEVDLHAAKLRTASRHLGSAMQQMAHAGTREQKTRAVEVLNEARRKLYAILGELDVEEDTDDE